MLKRSLSLLLCAVLTLSLCLFALPETALAGVSEVVYLGGTEITPGYWTYDNATHTLATATSASYNVHYQPASATATSILTLKGVTVNMPNPSTCDNDIFNPNTAALYSTVPLTIDLIGRNELTGANCAAISNGKSAGIYINAPGSTLNIISSSKTGSLTTTGSNAKVSAGVCADSSTHLIISGGTVEAKGGDASQGQYSYGITSNKGFEIKGGNITATGGTAQYGSYGVCCQTDVMTISAGTLNATGGTITIPSGYSTCGVYSPNGITVSGGTVTATGGTVSLSEGSAPASYGIRTNADGGITISGGTVEAKGNTSALSKAPTIDSNFRDADVRASINMDGSVTNPDDSIEDIYNNIYTYKYFKVFPVPVSIENLGMYASATESSYYTNGINGINGASGTVTNFEPEGGWNAKLELVEGKYKLTIKDLHLSNAIAGIKSNVDLDLYIADNGQLGMSTIYAPDGEVALLVNGNLNISTAETNLVASSVFSENASAVKVTGNLTLNGACCLLATAYTDGTSKVAAIDVGGNLTVGENSWIYSTVSDVGDAAPNSANCGIKVQGDVVMSGEQMNCIADSGLALKADGSIKLNSGYITLSGSDGALSSEPDLDDYTSYVWTTDAKAKKYNTTEQYVFNGEHKFLSILPTPSAAISEVEVSGTANTAITPKTAVITLKNQIFMLNSTDVSSWFTNMPAGLTASITQDSDCTATVTFSGTPTKEFSAPMTVVIPEAELNITIGVDRTITNSRATWNIAAAPSPDPAPSGGDGGSDYTPATITVYNDPVQPKATVWLSGSGLAANDQLVTKPNPQGAAFTVMRTVAGKNEVIATYDISLQSGKKSTGSAMSLTFDIDTKHAGQEFTLVHQKADGTLEYFYAVADSSGRLVFNAIYSLSPFMIVKGRLAQTAYTSLTDMPKTGDSAQTTLAASIVLLMAAASLACVALRKRHD